MSAQTTADLAKAAADLAAVTADAKADDAATTAAASTAAAALAASQQALHTSQTALTAAVAEENRLTALFKTLGLDPVTGKPVGSAPPPPPAPSVGTPAYDAATYVLTVPFTGAATAVSRDGSDSTGYGPWNDLLTPGYLAAANAARKAAFSGMNVPGATFKITIGFASGPIQVQWTSPGTPPVTPPVIPPAANFVYLGCYNGYGLSGKPAWDAKIGRRSDMPMTYVATTDTGMVQQLIDYAKANPRDMVKMTLNVLGGEAGNFGSQAERDRCRVIFRMIGQAGVAHQFVDRHMYEANANYGFEWQAASHGGDFAGQRKLFDDIADIARQEAPGIVVDQCVVPWTDYAGHTAPELDLVFSMKADLLGIDWYCDNQGANVFERLDNGIAYALAKFGPGRVKRWCLDEWASRDPSQQNGCGDNPAFIQRGLTKCLTDPACHSNTFFDSADGGVGMVLAGNSLAMYRSLAPQFALAA